jgi:hypothetical protein
MGRIPPFLAPYVQSDHLLAKTVNKDLEIRSGINIKIDIQKLGVWAAFLYGHAVSQSSPLLIGREGKS